MRNHLHFTLKMTAGGSYLQTYTASHRTRPQSPHSPPW